MLLDVNNQMYNIKLHNLLAMLAADANFSLGQQPLGNVLHELQLPLKACWSDKFLRLPRVFNGMLTDYY